MKRVNWHIPEAAGVNVWPNVSPTRDELGSQVRRILGQIARVWPSLWLYRQFLSTREDMRTPSY